MSIKLKILVPMILLTVIAMTTLLCAAILLFSNYVDNTLEEKVATDGVVALNELEIFKGMAETLAMTIAADPFIMEGIVNEKPEALLTRAEKMQEKTGADFCTVTDNKGLVLARAHAPGQTGDDLSTKAQVAAALTGESLAVVESEVGIALAVCAAAPVYDARNRLAGVVSCGLRLDNPAYIESVKSLMNCEIIVYAGNTPISATIGSPQPIEAETAAMVLAGEEFVGQSRLDGEAALLKYLPLTTQEGTVLGMLTVGRYLKEKTLMIRSFLGAGLVIMLVMQGLAIVIILLITRRIIRPIKTMVDAAHGLAVGDTEVNIHSNSRDEMAELAGAFNEMLANTRAQTRAIEAIAAGDLTVSLEARSAKDVMNNALNSMLTQNNQVFAQIAGVARQVANSSHQIADSSRSLANSATEQAASVQQLLATISEVESATRDNAALIGQTAALEARIKSTAEKGSEQMQRMVQAVKEIDDSSHAVSKIIRVIDDIAFQTNILALNAAVEAARAGQHGKGFAVVAEEVRSLAAKSAAAAQDTGALIESSSLKAQLGVEIADETAASLTEIAAGIQESSGLMNDIAQSSQKQSTVIGEIRDGISQISGSVQLNSAAAEEGAAASEQMNAQSELLEELVSQFKLNDRFLEQ